MSKRSNSKPYKKTASWQLAYEQQLIEDIYMVLHNEFRLAFGPAASPLYTTFQNAPEELPNRQEPLNIGALLPQFDGWFYSPIRERPLPIRYEAFGATKPRRRWHRL